MSPAATSAEAFTAPDDKYLDRCRRSFRFFAPRHIQIEPEEGGRLIPLKLNKPQRLLRECLRGVKRALVLKGRGMGVTTLGLAERVHGSWANPWWRCLFLAHTNDDTTKIFQRAQTMEEKLGDGMRQARPSTSRREIAYHLIGSSIHIATAGGRGPGRGGRLHDVHLSEVAQFPGDYYTVARLMAGIEGAARRGRIVAESTADGTGDWFHKTWLDARKWALQNGYRGIVNGRPTRAELKRLRNDKAVRRGRQWVPIFMPWWWDERNRIELDPEEREEFQLTDTEAEWAVPNKVPMEAVAWYRTQRAILKHLLPQEYPCTDLEAFLASGESFFDSQRLALLSASLPDPIRRMHGGATLIWEEPQEGDTYVIGADPCEGTADGDFAYASVHRYGDGRQVARSMERWKPKEFAFKVRDLANLYNEAMVAGERNAPEFVRRLAEIYPYQYHQEDPLNPGELDPRPGWRTTGANRQMGLDTLKEALEGSSGEAGWLLMRCAAFFADCATFKRNARTKKFEAESGTHDDSVMAVMIALQALETTVPRFHG